MHTHIHTYTHIRAPRGEELRRELPDVARLGDEGVRGAGRVLEAGHVDVVLSRGACMTCYDIISYTTTIYYTTNFCILYVCVCMYIYIYLYIYIYIEREREIYICRCIW